MAFPIPSHLPRKANSQDVPTKILTKIGEATNETLNASLATSWLTELDESIQSTKERIHERIHSDLPYFERQLESSKSVQERLRSLTTNVDTLTEAVSNPKTGVVSTLVQTLTAHATTAQEAADAEVLYDALSHLLKCKTEFASLSSLVQEGELPDAVRVCEGLEKLLEEAPSPLKQANVIVDLKGKFRAAKDRTEEQLSEAYSRSIVISPTELIVRPSVQIRQSDTVLPFPSILSSLSHTSLANHLTTLRRDLTTHYIDQILKQPTSITCSSATDVSGTPEYRLSHFPSPPNSENRAVRLENLSTILTFLSAHLLPFLPPSQAGAFPRSLCKPITTSLLNNLLIPSIPPSFSLLPAFLELVRQAVDLEERCIVEILDNERSDRPIKTWADGVNGHYERQRRLDILGRSRGIIIAPEDAIDTFYAEVEIPAESGQADVIPVQTDESNEPDTEAWGFDDDENPGDDVAGGTEENGWGFDDGLEPEPVEDTTPESATNGDADPDPADAWGWNDDDDSSPPEGSTEETAWDDPWSEEPSTSSSTFDSQPSAPSITSPKVAKRLEKFTSKGKKVHLNGDSPSTSPVSASPALPGISQSAAPSTAKSVGKRPPKLADLVLPNEKYIVSRRMEHIVKLVKDVLDEGKEFASSRIFTTVSSESSSAPGTLLIQSATSILDLFRALYPVKFNAELVSSSERAMRFSNNCLYLSDEIEKIEAQANGLDLVKERLRECKHRLKVLGDSWFDDTIEKQRQSVDDILKEGAEGFTYTAEQDRYDECETAVSQVLQEVRRLAQRWKGILTKSKYYIAIGLVTDAALSRVLEDVLALPDIPEVESHRLSELCRILNALEGLFVEDSSKPSFAVAYVPSWLKFSYLSELLEASMADISYLFEEGALVDFDVEELVRLVRALFADTPLRTTTINKLLGGHPVPSQ